MGRVRSFVTANGRRFWTLFDSGARYTYVVEDAAGHFHKQPLEHAFEVKLGGKTHKLREVMILQAKVEGKPISTRALVVDELGKDEKDTEIQILIGALTMQEWGIELNLEKERLDLTHYPKEFTEF